LRGSSLARFTTQDKFPAIPFVDACSIIAEQAASILSSRKPDAERCELSDCLGRVLASPVVADRDQPPFARAIRDGYAVRAQDVAAGSPLRVIGQIRAGQPWPVDQAPLQAGQAIEIMTGAPLPAGADAVLMVEHVEQSPQIAEAATASLPFVRIVPQPGKTLKAGENVVQRGSEARQGQRLIEAGKRLGPDDIGLAASCGLQFIDVYYQPRLSILATGDEIVELAAAAAQAGSGQLTSEPHQIYNSNTHALAALVRQAHAIPLIQSIARDRKPDLSAAIRRAIETANLTLITGGVSMGRYDLVQDVLAELGTDFLFAGVKIQPGKPVVLGRRMARDSSPRFVFGLPGNPVSALVTFRLFVQPLLAAISGERDWQPRVALARLAGNVESKPGLTRFLPAFLDTARLEPTVTAVPTQGSGDLAANARANCYIIVPDRESSPGEGQLSRVLLR
jgi:molybdopterin molybdotransferase